MGVLHQEEESLQQWYARSYEERVVNNGRTTVIDSDGATLTIDVVAITAPVLIRLLNSKGDTHCRGEPAVITQEGTRAWYQNGRLHRLDGPAIITHEGNEAWYQNGQRHRLDGPAIEYADGQVEWFVHGERILDTEVGQIQIAANENTSPDHLATLTRGESKGIAALAAHNPNCPKWVRVEYVLTRGNAQTHRG